MAEGAIEIAPVGFMRGRTLNNAFVVIDEAQNCTYVQLKMLLTRLGWNSTMVVTGDPRPVGPAARALRPRRRGRRGWRPSANIAVVRLADGDIVRHPLVGGDAGGALRGGLRPARRLERGLDSAAQPSRSSARMAISNMNEPASSSSS